jgi:F-box/leucine-rich repeat protein 5
MVKLVNDIERELSATDFCDAQSYLQLLGHLSTNFHVFQTHEEIENRYIVGELMPRLPCNHKAKLENDLHSNNRLSTLVNLVSEGLQMGWCSEEARVDFGERLKTAIASFTVDFLPHMREEEEVFLPLLVQYFSEPELKKLTRDVIELHHLNDFEDLPVSSSSSSTILSTKLTAQNGAAQRPSLLQLPPEVLLVVLRHLGPRDLLRLSITHPSLQPLTFDPSLWTHLHPVRWACGHWEFFSPPAFTLMAMGDGGGGGEEEVMAIHDAVIENDAVKELMSVEGNVNANLRGKK